MSAILAGDSCKKCEKSYWTSFGHPQWFDDVVKRNKIPCEQFREFQKMRSSGMCLGCYRETNERD